MTKARRNRMPVLEPHPFALLRSSGGAQRFIPIPRSPEVRELLAVRRARAKVARRRRLESLRSSAMDAPVDANCAASDPAKGSHVVRGESDDSVCDDMLGSNDNQQTSSMDLFEEHPVRDEETDKKTSLSLHESPASEHTDYSRYLNGPVSQRRPVGWGALNPQPIHDEISANEYEEMLHLSQSSSVPKHNDGELASPIQLRPQKRKKRTKKGVLKRPRSSSASPSSKVLVGELHSNPPPPEKLLVAGPASDEPTPSRVHRKSQRLRGDAGNDAPPLNRPEDEVNVGSSKIPLLSQDSGREQNIEECHGPKQPVKIEPMQNVVITVHCMDVSEPKRNHISAEMNNDLKRGPVSVACAGNVSPDSTSNKQLRMKRKLKANANTESLREKDLPSPHDSLNINTHKSDSSCETVERVELRKPASDSYKQKKRKDSKKKRDKSSRRRLHHSDIDQKSGKTQNASPHTSHPGEVGHKLSQRAWDIGRLVREQLLAKAQSESDSDSLVIEVTPEEKTASADERSRDSDSLPKDGEKETGSHTTEDSGKSRPQLAVRKRPLQERETISQEVHDNCTQSSRKQPKTDLIKVLSGSNVVTGESRDSCEKENSSVFSPRVRYASDQTQNSLQHLEKNDEKLKECLYRKEEPKRNQHISVDPERQIAPTSGQCGTPEKRKRRRYKRPNSSEVSAPGCCEESLVNIDARSSTESACATQVQQQISKVTSAAAAMERHGQKRRTSEAMPAFTALAGKGSAQELDISQLCRRQDMATEVLDRLDSFQRNGEWRKHETNYERSVSHIPLVPAQKVLHDNQEACRQESGKTSGDAGVSSERAKRAIILDRNLGIPGSAVGDLSHRNRQRMKNRKRHNPSGALPLLVQKPFSRIRRKALRRVETETMNPTSSSIVEVTEARPSIPTPGLELLDDGSEQGSVEALPADEKRRTNPDTRFQTKSKAPVNYLPKSMNVQQREGIEFVFDEVLRGQVDDAAEKGTRQKQKQGSTPHSRNRKAGRMFLDACTRGIDAGKGQVEVIMIREETEKPNQPPTKLGDTSNDQSLEKLLDRNTIQKQSQLLVRRSRRTRRTRVGGAQRGERLKALDELSGEEYSEGLAKRASSSTAANSASTLTESTQPQRTHCMKTRQTPATSTCPKVPAIIDLTDIGDEDIPTAAASVVDGCDGFAESLRELQQLSLEDKTRSISERPRCNYLEPLTDAESKLARDLTTRTRGDTRVVTITEAKITLRGESFKRLRGTRWLDDEILNAYVSLINSRNNAIFQEMSEEDRAGVPRAYVFNTYFFTRLCSGSSGFDYPGVQGWTKRAKIDILQKDIILIPINLGNHHWVLSGVDMEHKEILYLDSMHGSDRVGAVGILKRWVFEELCHKHGEKVALEYDPGSWIEVEQKYRVRRVGVLPETLEPRNTKVGRRTWIPRQTDGGSCGVFTAKIADCLSVGIKVYFNQGDIPIIRKRMALDLFRGYVPL